jgi:predicted signal transduction protein with EAL and GGDEF domain
MTPSEIQKKVWSELLWSTPAIILANTAAALFAFGWAIDSSKTAFGGVVAILAAVGVMINNIFFGYDKAFEKVMAKVREISQKEDEAAEVQKERELDALHENLSEAKGRRPFRDETALTKLRRLREELYEDMKSGIVAPERVTGEMLADLETMFNACVNSLKCSYVQWRNAQAAVTVERRRELMAKRDKIIDDIEESVDRFAETISGVRELGITTSLDKLGRLREQLAANLNTARQTEERLSAFENEFSEQNRV